MGENKNSSTVCVCKSVFKNGKSTTTEQEYTKGWALLIRTLEKNKSVNFFSVSKEMED